MEDSKTVIHNDSPGTVREYDGASIAIVSIIVVFILGLVLALIYWNSIFPVRETTVIHEINPEPSREVVTNTNTRETNTIIQPNPVPTPIPSSSEPAPTPSPSPSGGY